MMLHECLVHLASWLRSFPWPRDDGHLWCGLVGGETEECMVCGRTRPNDERDEEIEASWYEGQPLPDPVEYGGA